ncbi:MAG: hypothetical protein WC291_09040 [Thermodesulfovibrionales bacterium]|jgi:hypothetical protein
MSYSEELAAISRTPVTLVVITLDYCGRTFGVSPCTATGTPCFNTFPTCRMKTAYLRTTKDYRFSSADAPLPFRTGERPYLKRVGHLPTEIKDNLTITGRVTIEAWDEPDADVGIDPYVTQRDTFPDIPGTYWKKLLARNRNFKGRPVKVYEGFTGITEAEYQQKAVGVIENITLGKGEVKIEVVDLLKALANIEVPPKLDIKLVADITDVATDATLSTLDGLDSPSGYIRIGDEIIRYTGTVPGSNQITGCSRHYFDTVPAEHKAKDKVQKVRYYAPGNPFDHLKTMLLTDAGMDAASVNSTEFNTQRDWPGGEVNFSAIVSEPTKLSTLYFEVVGLLDSKSWVAEDLKVTIRRNLPNQPGRPYTALTDEANIIEGSADLNEKSRISRVILYWDKTALGKVDDPKEYNRIDIAVDADAESSSEYGDSPETKFFCRWLRSGYVSDELMEGFVKDFITRQVWRQRDASPIIPLDVELKDSEIKTGDFLRISTDELLNPDGTPLNNVIFQVIKREPKGSRVSLKTIRLHPRRLCFIAPDGAPDYDAATDADKEYGYMTEDTGLMADESDGYYTY